MASLSYSHDPQACGQVKPRLHGKALAHPYNCIKWMPRGKIQ